jgi:hypothetical protein
VTGHQCAVVDTNVLAVANRMAPHADPACVLAAVALLRNLQTKTRPVLDNLHQIFDEYRSVVGAQNPGAGWQFIRWLYNQQYNPKRCERVDITALADDPYYDPYPEHIDFSSFDVSDRKFISAAIATRHSAPIINATDSDWCDVRIALASECGIEVVFVCPDTLSC